MLGDFQTAIWILEDLHCGYIVFIILFRLLSRWRKGIQNQGKLLMLRLKLNKNSNFPKSLQHLDQDVLHPFY